MTGLAFTLVLASAFLHATWNLFAKRVSGGPPFIWLISALATVFYLPIAIVAFAVQQPHIGLVGLALMLATSLLHVAYYILLDRGYRAGDLSLVYPLSRGTGPLLSIGGAVLLLGERPDLIVVWGALLITLGVLILIGNPFKIRKSDSYLAVLYGLMSGIVIAAYTITDKVAVSVLLIPPIVYLWVEIFARTVWLTLLLRGRWHEVRTVWLTHRRETLIVAVLDPLSYTLFLAALVIGQVSYLAPVRQVSILIGALLGARLLSEGRTVSRLVAATVMLAGLVVLAVS